jgi:predicted nucleic acid-binding Zn ribbon protein
MLAPHPKECPGCDANITRIFTAPGVIYKTGGFYSTDVKALEPTEDEIIEHKLDQVLAGKSPD